MTTNAEVLPGLKRTLFGTTADGTPVDLFALTNRRGVVARIASYGGTLVSLDLPDRDGKPGDVVLGYDALDGYLARGCPYFGCLVGRYANRIAEGRFTLGGRTYELARNDGENHLHGGLKGFDKFVWAARAVGAAGSVGVELERRSEDGEEGYPGNLSVTVRFTLDDEDELRIDYSATTDRTTICNLTHHGYFNLDGAGNGDILEHRLMIDADRFTPVGKGLIPTGELRRVAGTAMDFTRLAAIGARIGSADEQIVAAGGYDHNWVLNRAGRELSLAARLVSPRTGRAMEVLTTEPGLQFYSGNFLGGDGAITGKGGKVYGRHAGLCLETQHFPDSPHQPGFPSTVLEPGETYRTTTIYRFSVADR